MLGDLSQKRERPGHAEPLRTAPRSEELIENVHVYTLTSVDKLAVISPEMLALKHVLSSWDVGRWYPTNIGQISCR